jgi:hypothetical protein
MPSLSHHRTLAGPPITEGQDPVFQNTRLEPFLDQADHACVIDPMLQETDQPLLADRIEEASDTAADERYSLIVRTTLEVGRPSLTGPFTCFRIASS